MSSVDQVLIGRIGIAPAGQGNPTIILDSTTGTISGNFTINANTNFNAPNVNASFESLLLSDQDFSANSTNDRLIVQLPNSNDTIKIAFDGRLEREASNGSAWWELGAPEANNGFSFRINTSQPNLQLYAPDSGGQVALYNTLNTGYAWRLTPQGGLVLGGNITCQGNANVSGNVQVNGTLNASQVLINGLPVERDSSIPVFVNANYFVPDDGIDRDLYISAGAVNIIVTVPANPATQQQVNCVIFNAGTAPFIGLGDGTPSLSFVGGGAQTAGVNLLNAGPSGSSLANHWVRFKFVNYGASGDWWQWSA